MLNSQFDRLYNVFVPAQQAIVTRDRFLTCYERADIPAASLLSWKTIDTLHVRLTIWYAHPRLDDCCDRAVPRSIEDTGQTGELTQSAHLLIVNGSWRWILKTNPIAAFKRGGCPKA